MKNCETEALENSLSEESQVQSVDTWFFNHHNIVIHSNRHGLVSTWPHLRCILYYTWCVLWKYKFCLKWIIVNFYKTYMPILNNFRMVCEVSITRLQMTHNVWLAINNNTSILTCFSPSFTSCKQIIVESNHFTRKQVLKEPYKAWIKRLSAPFFPS